MNCPAGNRRFAMCSKNTSSGTRPGTATTVQPVSRFSSSLIRLKSGMPARCRSSASRPFRNGSQARPVSPVYSEISEAIYNNVFEVLNGRQSADAAASKMNSEIEGALERF